jgi:hypothetical protein
MPRFTTGHFTYLDKTLILRKSCFLFAVYKVDKDKLKKVARE